MLSNDVLNNCEDIRNMIKSNINFKMVILMNTKMAKQLNLKTVLLYWKLVQEMIMMKVNTRVYMRSDLSQFYFVFFLNEKELISET